MGQGKKLNNQVVNFYAPKDILDGITLNLPVLDFDYLEQLTLGDKEFQFQLIETF
ncbi:MAG: hypothetical protein HC796_03330 [Synechococcaceae cyanobacterium RL_1_2]|nr:hypothetical protein [Synechococcaceae cyanobacterium RL_1_2]